jgi:hypothetical protein
MVCQFSNNCRAKTTKSVERCIILIGGYSPTDNANHSSIYKLICDQLGCKWSEMKQQLKIARNTSVAMLIPDTLTNCTKT